MPPDHFPADSAFRAFLESLDDAVFLVDEWWRPVWRNTAAERMLCAAGVARDGSEMLELFTPDTRERVVLEASAVASNAWRAPGELVAYDSAAVTILVSGVEAGAPPGWRWVRIVDRSTQRTLESALRESRGLEQVGKLALALSHEFSELLTTITGSAELLASELSPRDAVRADVEAIRSAADRASALTRELARSATSRASAPQRIDLSRAVAALEAAMRRIVGERVAIVMQLNADATAVSLDVSQLEGAILHLAKNAAEALPQGGELKVNTRMAEVTVPRRAVHGVMRPGRYAVVEVADTGAGMDEATVSRAFDPLFSTRGHEGLGLSLVFGAVTQMGGYVTCDSAVGEGTTIALFLPLVADVELRSAAAHLGARSILVVDDEEAVRRVAARTLRREGYRVFEARDADEALALVSRDPSIADLLVTDVVMPGLSGVELASCIVAARPDVRVLFSSGASAMSGGDALRIPRGAAFLPKPFTPKALSARVRSLFGL